MSVETNGKTRGNSGFDEVVRMGIDDFDESEGGDNRHHAEKDGLGRWSDDEVKEEMVSAIAMHMVMGVDEVNYNPYQRSQVHNDNDIMLRVFDMMEVMYIYMAYEKVFGVRPFSLYQLLNRKEMLDCSITIDEMLCPCLDCLPACLADKLAEKGFRMTDRGLLEAVRKRYNVSNGRRIKNPPACCDETSKSGGDCEQDISGAIMRLLAQGLEGPNAITMRWWIQSTLALFLSYGEVHGHAPFTLSGLVASHEFDEVRRRAFAVAMLKRSYPPTPRIPKMLMVRLHDRERRRISMIRGLSASRNLAFDSWASRSEGPYKVRDRR